MNFFSRHKVIIWILAGLLIITLSILGSMIYYTWTETEEEIARQGCSSSCQMLFDELDLDAAQNEEMEQILDHFRDSSAALITELRHHRLALMEELQKDDPDSLKIRVCSKELGATQARMTNLAASQYLRIRTICTPDQQQKLSNIYCDLFGCPRIGYGKREGLRKNYQYRNRHSQQGQ